MTSQDLWVILSCSDPSAPAKGFHELREGGESTWILVRDRRRFVRKLSSESLSERTVSVCPRLDMDPDHPFAAQAHCLWARVEKGPSVAALQAFSRVPTVVLRDRRSIRRTALWALGGPLTAEQAMFACRRLAHRFGGRTVRDTDPATFMVVPPGLRVEVEGFSGRVYGRANDVVGGLKDPPAPRDWRAERSAAA